MHSRDWGHSKLRNPGISHNLSIDMNFYNIEQFLYLEFFCNWRILPSIDSISSALSETNNPKKRKENNQKDGKNHQIKYNEWSTCDVTKSMGIFCQVQSPVMKIADIAIWNVVNSWCNRGQRSLNVHICYYFVKHVWQWFPSLSRGPSSRRTRSENWLKHSVPQLEMWDSHGFDCSGNCRVDVSRRSEISVEWICTASWQHPWKVWRALTSASSAMRWM